jgi:DNA invertase Pin-like site-specific DNA recombinase
MFPLEVAHLKIAKYRRKSSEDEDRQVASLADQAVALDEVAGRFRIHPSQVVADFGESRSAKLSHARPEFQKMVEMIERGKANAILAWHPDRLSRNLGDVDTLVRLMESGKLTAIITPQYMFGNTPLEKYILISECTRAKLENDNKGVNTRRGLIGKVRKGWRPGPARIGYLNDTTKPHGERDLVPDPERFDKVKRLLHLFLTGNYSVRILRKIAKEQLLLRTRQTRRRGGKPLSLSHVYCLLTEPFYCGKFWWKSQETGEKVLHQGKHPPMITEDEFWQIQAILGKQPRPQPIRLFFAYTALMACGECGAAITAEEQCQMICGTCKMKFASKNKTRCPGCGIPIESMAQKKLLHYVYYHCTKKRRPCSQKAVRLEDLEAQIDRTLTRFNICEKYARWALDTLKSQETNDDTLNLRVDQDIKRERTKIKEELADLNRFIVRQESAGWTLMSREETLAEKQRLLVQLKSLEPTDNSQATDGFDETASTLDYACHARLWLREGTLEQKREVFAALGSNLTLKDKKVRIDLTYPLPEIERMIEIASEIISRFEPTEHADKMGTISTFGTKIPDLVRGLNAIRTYFQNSGKKFWQPQHTYFPTIRISPVEDGRPNRAA